MLSCLHLLTLTHTTQHNHQHVSSTRHTEQNTAHNAKSLGNSDNNRNFYSIYALHFEYNRHRGITDTINWHARHTHKKKIVVYSHTDGVISMSFSIQFSHAKWQNTVYMYLDWKLDREKKAEWNKKRLKQWAKLMWKRDGEKKIATEIGARVKKNYSEKMRLLFTIVFCSIVFVVVVR